MAIYFTQNTNSAEDIEQMNKVIDKMNQASANATSNINQLTDLNAKAEELSNNVNQALPINTDLKKNIEIGKPLVQEAASKNTELQASLEKTKEFIEGLDGSQNIPQLRLDVTELQNGLKSNQALAYTGSSISADNTLEGRTEGMRIGGRTLVNLVELGNVSNNIGIAYDTMAKYSYHYNLKNDTDYTIIFEIENKTDNNQVRISLNNGNIGKGYDVKNGINILKIRSNAEKNNRLMFYYSSEHSGNGTVKNIILLEGDWTNKEIPSYFEGLKSFGEAEQEGDKYKISILSSGKNLTNCKFELGIWNVSPTDQEPNKQSNSNYVRSSELIDISKFNDQQISISLNGKSVEGNIKYYTKDRKYIKDVFNAPFNPVPNAFYITIHVPLSRFSKYDEFQIETGSNSTSYEPYKCDKKDILIKEPLKEREYIYEDNGQVKVCRKSYEYTLNGENEDWIVWTNSTGDTVNAYVYFNRMTPNLSGIVKPNSSNTNDRLPANQGGYLSTKEGFKITSEYFAISIHKSKLGVTNVNDPNNSTLIKKWLKENPITMICQLATPTIEIVENCVDIDLDTFQDKTYFNILNSLPGTLDFKVPSNLGSVVQNMAKEVNNIWDVINNLLVPSLIDINKNVAMSTIKNNLK